MDGWLIIAALGILVVAILLVWFGRREVDRVARPGAERHADGEDAEADDRRGAVLRFMWYLLGGVVYEPPKRPLRGYRRLIGAALLLAILIFFVVSIIVWGIPDDLRY